MILDALDDFLDVVEHLLAACLVLRRRDEVRRQLRPPVLQLLHPLQGIALGTTSRQLVGLGEDDGERHVALAQPVDELAIDELLIVTDVDKHKEVGQLPALQHVLRYHLLKFVAHGLGSRRIAVAGKVNQIPLVVDDEVVDEQRLAGLGRRLGQSLVVAEHIDETRLANVGATDEGKL